MSLPAHTKAVIALIIANMIWGAAPPIFKWSLQNIDPFTLAFLRYFIAMFLLLPFCMKNLHVAKKDYLKLFLVSFFGITINISFFFLGLRLTDSINVPIIGSSASVFILLGSIFFLKEQPKLKVIAGTLLSLLGVLTIILGPAWQSGFSQSQSSITSILGNILILIAVLGSVGHTLLLRPLSKNYNPITLTFWSFLIGAITFLPLMIVETGSQGFLQGLNHQGIIGIVFGAILSSAAAYTLYNFALKHIVANEAGLFFYLDPIVTVLIAIPLLGEKITLPFLLGALLVFFGIFLAEGRLPYHPLHKLKES